MQIKTEHCTINSNTKLTMQIISLIPSLPQMTNNTEISLLGN